MGLLFGDRYRAFVVARGIKYTPAYFYYGLLPDKALRGNAE